MSINLLCAPSGRRNVHTLDSTQTLSTERGERRERRQDRVGALLDKRE